MVFSFAQAFGLNKTLMPLLCFSFSSFLCPLKDAEGVATLHSICINADLDSALVPVPAVPCLLNADCFGPFAVVCFCTQEFVGKRHQVHISNLWEIEMSHLWDVRSTGQSQLRGWFSGATTESSCRSSPVAAGLCWFNNSWIYRPVFQRPL
jgi:hypothetical protein